MTDNAALEAYLTDHIAGSLSASDLAKRGVTNNDGPVKLFFTELSREIDTDRWTLGQIADSVGAKTNALKQAGAVAAERLSRFKIDHRMTGSSQLSLLLELELLYLGIQGKQALWRTLDMLADPRLAEYDFAKLIQRADDQLATLEEQRIAAAKGAFAS
jgi:hypothetical protein